ncbi:rod shape-determining protein MreD [Candidatus Rubidus massiliensis]|nr:MAG: hypothetical protein BGO10_06465 [Chlamydia sp. 32-24]CDZ80586.1 rod shape-determining protein MreD [Candidatus Rubidus massiliensis]
MNILTKNLKLTFFICFILFLTIPSLFSLSKIFFFTPFLITVYYQRSFIFSLWSSFFCGLIIDSIGSTSHFGIHALNFCVTTLLIRNQRMNFFADNLYTLPIMTYIFSSCSTIIHWVLLKLFDHSVELSFSILFIDFLLVPITDSIYAFCVFVLPSIIYDRKVKKEKKYA